METWLKISLLLSIFGFLKEIRPSEPFIYEFLIDKRWRNITKEEVQQDVYPVGMYSYLAQLFLVFLVTDLARYKPLIIILGLSGIATWAMLIWTSSLAALQVIEVTYGTFMATEVAYYTYIYAKVDKEYYQQVTSHTRAAILLGRALSGVVSQILISFELMNYRDLNYITLAAMILATIWSFFLPGVKNSIYFHKEDIMKQPLIPRMNSAFALMKSHFIDAFSNRYVLKWSFWWALSTCGFLQAQTYMQPLWQEIDPNANNIYNGAVEAGLTILGAGGAIVAGFLKIDWSMKGELTLCLCSILQGFILLLSSQAEHVGVSYACYIAFGTLFHITITIASAEVAKYIKEDSFGLVFGFNTFIALLIQTALTAIVVTKGVGFAMLPREQYVVYGIFHLFIAANFIVVGLTSWCLSKRDHRRHSSVIPQNELMNA